MENYIISNIDYLLYSHDMTQSDLANILNVSRQTISQWLKGITSPKHEKVKKLSEYFNIDVKDLLYKDLRGGTIIPIDEDKAPVFYEDMANIPLQYNDVVWLLKFHDLHLSNEQLEKVYEYAQFIKK